MKKNTILKVLSFVLLLTFVLSAVLLTGCGKQEDVAKQTDLEATNADLKSAKEEIAKLQTALNELKEASAASEALSQKVDALEAALEAVSGDPEAIRELVADIATAREELAAAKEELQAAVQEATDALNNLDEIYATDAELAAEIAALKEWVNGELLGLMGDLDDTDALASLQAQINNRLVKSDWIAATAVLFKGTEEPRSIQSFEAGIVRPYKDNESHALAYIAIQYEDEDVAEYEAKANLLEKKLYRAISIEDIDATFALRDAEFAKLVKIVDKFEAELRKWEPDRDESGAFIEGTGKLGFPGVEGDQLARLKYLHNLIIARNLPITEAQEERYQALLDAQARLRAIEREDNRIYARMVDFNLGREDVVLYKDETIKRLDGPLYLSKTDSNYTRHGGADLRLLLLNEVEELDESGKVRVYSIEEDYDYRVAPSFENAEKIIYYAVGMEDLPGYQNYVTKQARYWELDAARIAFETKYRADELTFFMDYNLSSPLLSSYDGIEGTDGAWLDGWKAKYRLEDIRVVRVDTIGWYKDGTAITEEVTKDFELENCFLIINLVDQRNGERLGGYKRVLAIRYFVQTLYDLNATYVEPNVYKDPHEDITTKNLVGQIKTEVDLGEKYVLWAHLPTLKDILNKQDIIRETIANLEFDLDSDLYPFWTEGAISYGTPAKKELCENRMLGLEREIRRDGRIYTAAEILDAIRERVATLEDTMTDLLDLGEYLYDRFYQNEQREVILERGATLGDLLASGSTYVTGYPHYETDVYKISLRHGLSEADFVNAARHLIKSCRDYYGVIGVQLRDGITIEDLLEFKDDDDVYYIDEYYGFDKGWWVVTLRDGVTMEDFVALGEDLISEYGLYNAEGQVAIRLYEDVPMEELIARGNTMITKYVPVVEANEQWFITLRTKYEIADLLKAAAAEKLIKEYAPYDEEGRQWIVTLNDGVTANKLPAVVRNMIYDADPVQKYTISLRYTIEMDAINELASDFIYEETLKDAWRWVATFKDVNYIKDELPRTVEDFFINRGIAKEVADQATNTANYNVMTRFFKISIYPYLEAASENLTKIMKEIYFSVKDIIRKENTYLPDLSKLIVAQADLFKITADYEVSTTDFELEKITEPVIDDTTGEPKIDPVTGEVLTTTISYKFSNFFDDLTGKVVRVVDMAQKADKDAAEINEKIELLEGKFNLNKTAVVDEVAAQLVDWAEKYLGVSFEALADEDLSFAENEEAYIEEIAQYFENTDIIKRTISYPIYIVEKGLVLEDPERRYEYDIEEAVNDGILNVRKYIALNTQSKEPYKFVTGANFTAFKATQAARVARYNSANAAWAELDMTPTANRYNIDKSFEKFAEYIEEYYTNIETDEDKWAAVAEYYHIRPATKEEIEDPKPVTVNGKTVDQATYGNAMGATNPTFTEGVQHVMKGDVEWTICYPSYQHKITDGVDMGVDTETKNGYKVPKKVTKTEDDWYGEVIQDKLAYENQWADGYRGTAVSMALREKAERFASYITGARFVEGLALDVAVDYVGEFEELNAYRSLCDRSAQYDRIMFLAELLDNTAVPVASNVEGLEDLFEVLEHLDTYDAAKLDAKVSKVAIQNVRELETVTRELKARIATFCDTFDYFSYEERKVYEFEYDQYDGGEYVVEEGYAVLVKDDDDDAPVFALDRAGKPVAVTADEDGNPLTYAAKTGILSIYDEKTGIRHSIYDDSKIGANKNVLDAELVAYVGAAKVYIINAFEHEEDYYFYVKETIETGGDTYYLTNDEETSDDALVIEAFVKLVQNATVTVDQVDTQLGIFRQQALKDSTFEPGFDDDEMYREFDFDSEDGFLKIDVEVDFAELFADYPERPVRPEEMEDDDEWAAVWNEYLVALHNWHVEHQDAQNDLLAARGIKVEP